MLFGPRLNGVLLCSRLWIGVELVWCGRLDAFIVMVCCRCGVLSGVFRLIRFVTWFGTRLFGVKLFGLWFGVLLFVVVGVLGELLFTTGIEDSKERK